MSSIDDVRERLDIVALVGDYTELKKAGRNHKALCPFHTEKTPSFVVFPDSGRWQCFGACAMGGDAFEFVMKAENLDFRGALEILARRVGVDLAPPSPVTDGQKAHRERLREAVGAAAAYFHERLLQGADAEPARAYLRSRAFEDDAARAFQLGWAPDSWSALGDALRGAGFTDDELLGAGLARERDGGGVYDLFRGRVVFPIRDARGRAIGFGARTLDPGGVPKYLNSPQSAIFDKSHVLYGLDRAARAIRAAGEAVVVEGYTDVVRAHAAGFENVVASLGTALTEGQIAALKRSTGVIVLALDADAAGQAATLRGLDVAQEAAVGEAVPVPTPRGWIRYEHRSEIELRVATLPAGRDPDDVVRDDPEAWRAIIGAARPVLAYLFEALTADLDLTEPGDKTAAADRLMPIIAGLPDPVARAAWVARLADLIRIDERALATRLIAPGGRAPRRGRAAAAAPAARDDVPAAGAPLPASAPRDTAAWLLGHLVVDPRRVTELGASLRAAGQPPLSADDLERLADRQLFIAVRYAAHGAPPPDAPPEHQLYALPEPLAGYAATLADRAAAEPPMGEDARVAALRTAALRLREADRRRALKGLRTLLAETGPDERDDFDRRVRELGAELFTLQRLLSPTLERDAGKLDRAVPGG